MPHNLFLHSSIIQTRGYPRDQTGKWMAIRYGNMDSCVSLTFALFINAAILILSAVSAGRRRRLAAMSTAPTTLAALDAGCLPLWAPPPDPDQRHPPGKRPCACKGALADGSHAPPLERQAYKVLSPTLGAKAASTLFAVALLASGQNSTITGAHGARG